MYEVSSTRFLLYSHDTYGLGHIRRTLSIAWGLESAFPRSSILCVTGSPRPHSFPFPRRADYLKLPAVTKDGTGGYIPRDVGVSFHQILALRSSVIDATIRAYQPNFILVDHAPLGMAGELVTALRQARLERPATRIVLGLRDIYDEGSRVREAWAREGTHTESGRYTAEHWLKTYAEHLEIHARQIERNLEAWRAEQTHPS